MKSPMKGLLLGHPEEEESEEDEAPELDAARDILSAIASKDATALSLALERHYESCQGSHETNEDDDEED